MVCGTVSRSCKDGDLRDDPLHETGGRSGVNRSDKNNPCVSTLHLIPLE